MENNELLQVTVNGLTHLLSSNTSAPYACLVVCKAFDMQHGNFSFLQHCSLDQENDTVVVSHSDELNSVEKPEFGKFLNSFIAPVAKVYGPGEMKFARVFLDLLDSDQIAALQACGVPLASYHD